MLPLPTHCLQCQANSVYAVPSKQSNNQNTRNHMNQIKIISVVGARPNFMKVAPLHRAFDNDPKIDSIILHTGQHYDEQMSDIFFNQLQLPKPNYYLGVAGGSHAQTTARIMLKFEEVLEKEKPNLVLVVGDVNSTVACALVAAKMGISIAHVEAGLRSNDRSMPEEINRILTDRLSDFLFVTEQDGLVNLASEGMAQEKVFFVGNVMIDSLVHYREQARRIKLVELLEEASLNTLTEKLHPNNYALMTMHRPSNVDHRKGLEHILQIIRNTTRHLPVVFPMHPRTRNKLTFFELDKSLKDISNLLILEPQGYLQFLHLMDHARLVITDSGGIQEETTFLQVPCLTFRSSTERPITTLLGTNQLLPDLNPDTVYEKAKAILEGRVQSGVTPPFWDGHTAVRIREILVKKLLTSA